jgi:hypothetical protein
VEEALVSRARSERHRLAGAATVAFALVACQSLIGASFDDVQPKCRSRQPPAPTLTIPQGGTIEFSVLASTVVFGEQTTAKGTKPPSQGFDLDRSCTNRGDTPICIPPAYTRGDPSDGPHGEDNSVARLVGGEWSELGLDPPPVSSDTVTQGVHDGKFAPLGLFHVSGYIGYDDDSVDVDWYIPLAAKFDPDGPFVPKLDGSDVWPVLADDASGGNSPLVFKAKTAYVANRTLVAFFDEGRVPFINSYFVVHDVVLTANLDSTSGAYLFTSALIGGWGYSSELLKLLPGFTSELFGVPLCTNIAIYGQQIKPWLCAKLDLLKGATAGSPCNAFSIGLAFDSVPVQIGKPAPAPPAAACPPEFSPSNDDCNVPPQVGDAGNPFDAGS